MTARLAGPPALGEGVRPYLLQRVSHAWRSVERNGLNELRFRAHGMRDRSKERFLRCAAGARFASDEEKDRPPATAGKLRSERQFFGCRDREVAKIN
jgi:hypothetical protein